MVTSMRTGLLALSGVLVCVVGTAACGSSDPGSRKSIERATVPDSPFKPVGLETTVDGLVDALTDTEEDTFDVSVILKNLGGYWEPVEVGSNRAITELSLTGQTEAPVAPEDAKPDAVLQLQVDLFKERVDDGYQAFGVAPLDAIMQEEVDNAVDAGIPVVTIDSDLPDSKRNLYIGTNNTEAGKAAGETLADLIGQGSGTVLLLGTTIEGWTDGFNRSEAAKEALEDAGYTVILDDVGWDQETIDADLAEDPPLLAEADPPAVGCLGMFSNAYRCADIAEAAGFAAGDLKIAAFDFEPDTLTRMEEGYVQATHVQRQYYMGYLIPYALYSIRTLGMDATVDLLAEQMITADVVDTGVDVVQADQVDTYSSFLDELGIGG
jgi:ribose transport system substrate-binding protein